MSGEVKITQKLERWIPYGNTVKLYDLNGATIYYEDFHDGYVLEIPREIGKKYFEIKEKKILEIELPYTSKEVDKIKIEFVSEGNIYSGILGRGKYVYIEVPPQLIIVKDRETGWINISSEVKEDILYKLQVRYDEVIERRIVVFNIRKIRIRFKDGVVKEKEFPAIRFFIGNIKKNDVSTKLGVLSIYLTIWKKEKNIPENILIGEIKICVIGHALFKGRIE